ncbi:hypothetical protein SDJN03_21614, partial [Cucurbita argyrosperma subsp. sororia]
MQISPGVFRGNEPPFSVSTIFISAFLTTVPQAPGFIGNGSFANAKPIVSTGPASVIPYPCNQQNFSDQS